MCLPLSHRNRTALNVSGPLSDAVRRMARVENRMLLDSVEELLRRVLAARIKTLVRQREPVSINEIRQPGRNGVTQSEV